LSKRKPSLAEILATYRILIIALLALPVLGMVAAFVVIFYTHPASTSTALVIIAFVAVMYSAIMVVFMKQLDKIAEIDQKRRETIEPEAPVMHTRIEPRTKPQTPSISLNNSDQLTPEEERIFNIEKKPKESENNTK
jgi:glucan phosphoethanolaminetransferase (alkaline phosphatase superfamily)